MPVATLVPTPAPTPTPAGFLGVNISSVNYWNGDRAFMNLLVGSAWVDSTVAGLPAIAAAQVDGNGDLISLQSGQHAVKILTVPATSSSGNGTSIRCTWTGTASVRAGGTHTNDVVGDHSVQFTMPKATATSLTWIEVISVSSASPLRDVDCREADADRTAVFAPEFLQALKPFGILRFMDWAATNSNVQNPQWVDRTREGGLDQRVTAWENMAKLARTLDADAWYSVPYDAQQDYVVRLGQLIHDLTPAGRKVYVELGNEIWNYGFSATKQAQQEGIAEGLDSADANRAMLLRYAEKTAWLMKLWTPIFADRPGQLVRVISTQHSNAWPAEQVLGFRDTAQWVDALATAPYFGNGLLADNPTAAPAQLLPLVATAARDALDVLAVPSQAVAKRYGKRFIAYEAGQHLLDGTNVDRVAAINRSDEMYEIYRSYIADWNARYGDTMMLFGSTGGITKNGAWGLRERAGQAIAEAPKYRAALEFGRK